MSRLTNTHRCQFMRSASKAAHGKEQRCLRSKNLPTTRTGYGPGNVKARSVIKNTGGKPPPVPEVAKPALI